MAWQDILFGIVVGVLGTVLVLRKRLFGPRA